MKIRYEAYKVKAMLLIPSILIFLFSGILPGKILEIKTNVGKDTLLNPRQIIATNDEVFILDRGDETIKIFSKDGTFKTKTVGKGVGPGEAYFAITFTMDNHKFYVYDSMRKQIHVFSIESKKYLHSKKYKLLFNGYGPNSIAATDNGDFYFATLTLIKGQKVITKLDNNFQPIMAFLDCVPIYNSEKEYLTDKSTNPGWYLNRGYVAANDGKVYFAFFVRNKVLEFSENGKLLREFKLPTPSIEKEIKIKTYGDGSSDIERKLNYDLKINDNKVHVLSRDENNQSIIFALEDGKFIEWCRVKEPLTGFDIIENEVFGIDEDECIVHIYPLI